MTRNASWRQVVAVANFSTVGSTFAMAVAMATSYGTQVGLFLVHGVGWASYAVPATIDVIALMSNLALGLPRREGFSRGGLWFILILTLSVSAGLNFWAGANFIASTAHVWVVAAYLAAEYVRGWVKRYRAELEDEVEETTAAKQMTVTEPVADEAASKDLPEAPTSPAPASPVDAFVRKNGRPPSERHTRRLTTGR